MAKLPKGTFETVDYIDDDGVNQDPLKVQVKVTITDDEFICDFRGSHPQALDLLTAPIRHYVLPRIIFLSITNPSQDVNDGVFRPLKVIADEGSVFTAPASGTGFHILGDNDLRRRFNLAGFAPVLPHRLTAGHLLSVCAVIVSVSIRIRVSLS